MREMEQRELERKFGKKKAKEVAQQNFEVEFPKNRFIDRRNIELEESHTFLLSSTVIGSTPLSRQLPLVKALHYTVCIQYTYKGPTIADRGWGPLNPSKTTAKKVWASFNKFPLREYRYCFNTGRPV